MDHAEALKNKKKKKRDNFNAQEKEKEKKSDNMQRDCQKIKSIFKNATQGAPLLPKEERRKKKNAT